MTPDEVRSFLEAGTRTGKLAIVRKDGRPHVTPIWFALDGEAIIFMTHHTSSKAHAIRRDARVALVVDEEKAPYAFVLIEGTATVSEDPAALLHWATLIGGRYMGAARAEEYGRRNGVPGELLIRIHPQKVIARSGVAD